jgi:hypothetical protein
MTASSVTAVRRERTEVTLATTEVTYEWPTVAPVPCDQPRAPTDRGPNPADLVYGDGCGLKLVQPSRPRAGRDVNARA